jgi:predicted RNase H-like nuclease (RuvC/YqgF family)
VADGNPNVWALIVAAIVAGVPAAFAARTGLKKAKIQVAHEDERSSKELGSRATTDLLAGYAKLSEDLRAERADLTKHIVDLQESRQKLWDEIDRLHRLRQEENQKSRDALETCELRCIDATRKVESLSARIVVLELRLSNI